ncbi:dienelactone hydrolase family protein [Streptomyces sp. NPDC048290]|uniref:dienelactone hydrolase family protein n=1 Tax=Streptomyces sp. NPDC048290 TaxID=3155811 RepID=UPI00341F1AC6
MTAVHSTHVDVPAADGTADAYLVRPAGGGPHPGVLMYMDGFGLRPALTAMADRLAAAGYAVLLPNVFYRQGRAPVVELPEFIDPVARPELFQQVLPMIRALTPERAVRDADFYLRRLAEDPAVTDGPVGVVGYCLGARLALFTAGSRPDRVAAAAGFHGGNLASTDPDSPQLLADRITAELYFGHADGDRSNPPEAIERLEQALTAAGVRYRSEVYAGAGHGFTQRDTAAYDAAADERHWAALLELFGRTLQGGSL